MRCFSLLALFTFVGVSTLGCGGDAPANDAAVFVDAGVSDAGHDASVALDATHVVDGGADAPATPDAGTDGGADAGTDGGADAGSPITPWAHLAGGMFDDDFNGVAITPSGGVVCGGDISRSTDFGCGVLTVPTIGAAATLVLYGPTGTCAFSHAFASTTGSAQIDDVAVLATGDIVVSGGFTGTIDLGGGPLVASGNSAFVARFTATGSYVWANRYAASTLYLNGLAADATRVAIVGELAGTGDFGGGALSSAGLDDAFVAVLDAATGAHVWSHRYGDAMQQVANAVALDALGNLYVAGDAEGITDFGTGALTSAGIDVFVAAFTPVGVATWAHRYGDAATQDARAIAVTPLGNVVVAGDFGGSVDFGGGPLTSAGLTDAFVATLSPAGAYVRAARFGDAQIQRIDSVAVMSDETVFVAGTFSGTIDLGGGPLVSAGNDDMVLGRFAPGGAYVSARRFGDAMAQSTSAIATNGSIVALAGSARGVVDFGTGSLVSAGANDAAIAVVAP